MMKKALSFISMILLVISGLFANTNKIDTVEQLVSGYIGRNVELTIGDYLYNSGDGINLDIDSDSNNIRYLIAPTQVPCTKPGLLVGRFNLISSTTDITLTISHDLLNNGSGATVDYELAVDYVLQSGGTSTDSMAYITSTSPITLDFGVGGSVIIIENAGLYFRLCKEVTENGVYESTVTFALRTKT